MMRSSSCAFNAIGGTVDPQPIMDAIQAERSAPSGKLPSFIRAVLKKFVADAMQKEDGSGLETDPTTGLWGASCHQLPAIEERHRGEPRLRLPWDVQAALIRVKQSMDKAIEPAAPGFPSQAICGLCHGATGVRRERTMQKAEAKLYDAQKSACNTAASTGS